MANTFVNNSSLVTPSIQSLPDRISSHQSRSGFSPWKSRVLLLFVLFFFSSVQLFGQYTESDTLQAITRFYQAKAAGGVLRAISCGILAVIVATASTENPKPQVTTTPSAPGLVLVTTYTPPRVSNGEAGNIFGAVVFTGFAITGIIQASNHSKKHLDQALADYKNEKRMPKRFRYKEKYFTKR